MRFALLQDLLAIPGLDITATADPRLSPATPPGVRVLPPVAGAGRGFRRLIDALDAVWVIAPETGGILAGLAAAVEWSGRPLLGPGSATIRRASNKLALSRRLAARGIPTPRTVPHGLAVAPAARSAPSDPGASGARSLRGYPVVVKPALGAGCSGVGLPRNADELHAAVAAARVVAGRGTVILQEYIAGVAASVSLVCDGRRCVPLAVNAQRVRAGPSFSYHGGETPLAHPLSTRAMERAVEVCEAMPGLVGFIGVDLVLTHDDAIVIEVNPRLTTAYLGVRCVLDTNIAALVLAACTASLPAVVPEPGRRVRFTVDGAVEAVEAVA